MSQTVVLNYHAYLKYVAPRVIGVSEMQNLVKTDMFKENSCFYFDFSAKKSWEMYDLGVRLLGKEIRFTDNVHSIDSDHCGDMFFSTKLYESKDGSTQTLRARINYPNPVYLYQVHSH